MIRVLGNSPERVPIKDLDDIIYYKQIKNYTDQEYENSRDLKKAINTGKLTILEQDKSPRGSAETDNSQINNSTPSLTTADLKAVLKELIPEMNKNNPENVIKGAVREMAPLIADMIRQEISKLSVSTISTQSREIEKSKFISPEYIPDISTDRLIGSIEADERETKEDISDSLKALRALNALKNKDKK
jgi:hypothetical protein